jgi:hypothetical protein
VGPATEPSIPETLLPWVRSQIDSRQRPGTTSNDVRRIAELEREVRGRPSVIP